MKWYGGTSPYDCSSDIGDEEDNVAGGGGDPYSTPNPIHRAESVGGDTAQTNETEPLLGERLLLSSSHDDAEYGVDDRRRGRSIRRDPRAMGMGGGDEGGGIVGPKSLFLSPIPGDDDASAIMETGRSARDVPPASSATTSSATVATRPTAPPAGRSSSSSSSSSSTTTTTTTTTPWKLFGGGMSTGGSSYPRMGHGVNANSEVELDTLAYSRDHDDSTLFTSDDFVRRYLSSGGSKNGGGGGGGLLIRLSTRSLLLCIGLAFGIGLCIVIAIAYEVELSERNAGDDGANGGPSGGGTWHGVPYAKIDRESFGDPTSGIMDVSLFHPSLLYGGRILEEGRFFKNDRGDRNLPNSDPRPFLRVPFPTGAFWTNLVVIPVNEGGKTSSSSSQIDRDRFTYPIVAYPYSYQWSSLGKLQVSYSASRRVIRATTIQDQFAPDVTIGSVEGIGARHVVKFDSLSVTLRFYSVESIQHSWETYIVQGSPYITVVYSGLIPELRALSDFNDIMCPPTPQGGEISSSPIQQRTNGEGPNQRRRGVGIATASSSSTSTATTGKMLGICDIATDSSRQKKGITGVQFVVTTKEGLTWLVFASEPITFEFDLDAARLIKSRDKYTGVIRLALVPPEMVSDGSSATSLDIGHLQSSSGVKRLIYHAGTYPISGAVSWDFRSGMINPLASPTSPSTSTDKAHRRRAMERNVTRQLLTSDSPKDNNIGTVSFSFDTNHMTASSPSTDVPLLMLALPHHAASISSAEALLLRPDDFDLFYHSIKGRMVVVVGNIWSYEEELTSIGFGNDPAPASSLSLAGTSASSQRSSVHESTAILAIDQSIRDLILKNVESDLKINLPDLTGGAYSFGKQIARLAQLAHIAEVVDAANMIEIDAEVNRIKNDTNNDLHRRASSETSSLTSLRAFALLEKYLTMWLAGESDEMLVYDAQLGGILSKVGTTDINADFGNARYNDHHFHYGYVLFASAILGRDNPQFVSKYGPFVDALFYDVAHNGVTNNDFPLARHKSWFDGHSFASGLFPFADGKSQESSSEAVNCYYGAYLWSRVRWGGQGDRKMVDYARLLLATEMTGAKKYWHMMPPQDTKSGGIADSTTATTYGAVPVAYNPMFRGNYMVGNLGMTDVTCTTWFGTNEIYVHLINFMPVTPITSELFDKGKLFSSLMTYRVAHLLSFTILVSAQRRRAFYESEFVRAERSVLSSNDSLEIAWKGYSICNEAIIHPNKAWTEAQNLDSTQLDPGISKSQVLFWVSTRDAFSSTTKAGASSEFGHQELPAHPATGDSTFTSSCSSHLNCLAAGLEGSCCPTNDDIMLGCCS